MRTKVYLNAAQAAERLGISVRATKEFCKSGELPATKEGRAHAYRIALTDVTKFKKKLDRRGPRRGPKARVFK